MLLLFAGISRAEPAKKKPVSRSHHASRHHRRARKVSWKRRGQQAIKPDRAREIQEALIREHYLNGEPTGKWDERTQTAMTRYQADNGWQTKITPDSRALIKLGLGPNYSQEQLLDLEPKGDAVAANSGASTSAAASGATRDKQ
ncbi:MAG TPA: peptidoglycan-binding protein [Candidatus Limnocylindrales bacterium]|nr:peptidoglycan-binding protein [Candidatus Limnocylindrales bacterium]